MSSTDANHTTDELEAIREEGRAEGRAEALGHATPRPEDSTETIRRISRQEAKSVVKEYVSGHADYCRDEGPLCKVADKVDSLRTSSSRQNGALAILTLLGPIVLGLWLNSRANDRLSQQLNVAADVARQLKAVQDATKGGAMVDSPKAHFAQE